MDTDKIGINQVFFELGGNSLRATLLANQIHEKMGVMIPLKDIFQSPSIQELGKLISERKALSHRGDQELMLLKEDTQAFFDTGQVFQPC